MKSWNLTLAILMLGTLACLPKAQAISLSKTKTNLSESQLVLAQASTISRWKKVASTAWNFSGILPVEPGFIVMTKKWDIKYGFMEGQFAVNKKSIYGIAYAQLVIDLSEQKEQLFDGFASGFQRKYEKLVENRNISLGRYPGKEYTYQEGKKITKLRVFLAEQRIYALVVQNPAVGDASRFFNAFQIL